MSTVLRPGESREYANGYVARSWATDGLSYYAETDNFVLSPRFASFAEAEHWLMSTVYDLWGV